MDLGSGIRDPGSGKNLFRIPESKRHWNPDPDPQHCLEHLFNPSSNTVLPSPYLLTWGTWNTGSFHHTAPTSLPVGPGTDCTLPHGAPIFHHLLHVRADGLFQSWSKQQDNPLAIAGGKKKRNSTVLSLPFRGLWLCKFISSVPVVILDFLLCVPKKS